MEKKCGFKDLVGAHMSTAGGVHRSIEYGDTVKATAIQIFAKNARSWKTPPIPEDEIKHFKDALKNSECVKEVVVHCTYLINLASSKKEVREKSLTALIGEVQRAESLGVRHYVFHPGSHTGDGVKVGIKRIIKGLKTVISETDKIKITLENMAGQGTVIGSKLEELREILDGLGNEKRTAVCIDTCHAHAAGYDLAKKDGWEEFEGQLKKIIGLKHVEVMHLNDSKGACGSRLDRHANIGKGTIGLGTFKKIMSSKHYTKIPKVLETPAEELSDYTKEIALLRSFEK